MHKEKKGWKVNSDTAYQNSVTALLGWAHNEDITGLQDEDYEDEDDVPIDLLTWGKQLKEVLTAVEKVNSLLSV